MNRNDIIHNALAGAFWSCNASPYAMTHAVLKATHNEDIPEEKAKEIQRFINRIIMSKETTDFQVMVRGVAALLPDAAVADARHTSCALSCIMAAVEAGL